MTKVKKSLGIVFIFMFLLLSRCSGVLAVAGKVALIHYNPVYANVNANITNLTKLINEAFDNGANIIVAPEAATTGYCITRQQALDELGLSSPFPQLNEIRDLAVARHGYVIIGMVEVSGAQVYNTAVVFGPQGLIKTQDKRTIPFWNDPGHLPFDVISTPYGDLGVAICADSFTPDWVRILALKGADIVVTPANWWGRYHQEQTWQTRAKENGVWYFAANRWGREADPQNGEIYNMNDAPSAVINPDGAILQIYRAEDNPAPKDVILYQTIHVPEYRIGSRANFTYAVLERTPGAYGEIANRYYRQDRGNEPAPGLPPAGVIKAAALTYQPSDNTAANLQTIKTLWAKQDGRSDIIVLPGFGVSLNCLNTANPDWQKTAWLTELQNFVRTNSIALLVTTANEISGAGPRESLLIVRPGKDPQLIGQIHDGCFSKGTGAPPLIIDVQTARIGILTGHDALFPELVTALAKSGIDILCIPSAAGTRFQDGANYGWSIESLKALWQTLTNETMHVAASDWTGNGMLIMNKDFSIMGIREVNLTNPCAVMDFDTNDVRRKYLNHYYSYDLETLLSKELW